MDQILSRLQQLRDPHQNESKALQLCVDVINELNKDLDSKEIDTELLIDSGFIEFCVDVFENHSTLNNESKRIVAEVIAEIAKIENSRIPCSEEGIMKPLIAMLSDSDKKLVMQSCRAIGNVCYDNDIGRKVFADKRGIHELLALMNRLHDEFPQNMNKDAGVPNGRLLAVVSGCLLNSTNTFEYALEIAIEEGLIDVLLKYLRKFLSINEEIAIHCLLLLHCLADSDLGLSHICEITVLKELISLLDGNITEATVEALVEFFTNLSEDDSMKTKMTQLGLPQKLVELLNRNMYEDSVRKVILDFVTLILTEDVSMNLLYDSGNGDLYKQCTAWINSKDESMMKFGVLAIANFARSDTNCINMVKDGVHLKLLVITKQNSTID
ncbi:rap1 GTPase-GDP dissociation stimulator 1-B-like protein, partial [Leptotrombidium deliense]